MFVVSHTGLVPVTDNKGARDGIFGVTPGDASAGLLDGRYTLADVPEGIETYFYPDPTVAVAPVEPPADGDPVAIPENWNKPIAEGGLRPLQLMALAKAISGAAPVLTDEQKAADVKVTSLAIAIIEEELQRRAAASGSGE